MKFFNKILFIISSILLVTCVVSINKQVNDSQIKLEYDQLEPFPGQFQAATNTTNLDKANFTAPQMSLSLSESDPKHKLRLHDFMGLFHFVMYRMTRGEAEQIFLFADGNRNGLLDNLEWNNFVALYVLPFEACDQNGDYLLDEAEFGFCFEKDPKFKTIIFPRRYGTNAHIEIMKVMTTRQANLINFNEYLFTRRAIYGWTTCHSNAKYIARTSFSCALKTALSFERKMNFKLTDNEIYTAGLRIDNDFEIQLNYISYLRILHYFNLFNIYSASSSIAQLEKIQLQKAVSEDRLPNNLDEEIINVWYDLISANPFKKADSMGFKTFAFFWNLHRLFNTYSVQRPGQLNEEEVLKLLKDRTTPGFIVHAIDSSKTNFVTSQYQEASLSLHTLRPNESIYYSQFLSIKESENTNEEKKGLLRGTNFKNQVNEKNASTATFTSELREILVKSLTEGTTSSQLNIQLNSKENENEITGESQDASANTAAIWNPKSVNSSYYKTIPNESNRKVFFSIFRDHALNAWTKANFYKAFTLSNLFIFFVKDATFVVPTTTFVDNLMNTYILANPPINVKQRENYSIYKKFSREIKLDILTFLGVENYKSRIVNHASVPETLIKIVLQDFGMRNMPDTVLDLGLSGYGLNKERLFNADNALEKCLYVQSMAAENERMHSLRDQFNLKTNLDPSRRFPQYPRRAMASPHV